MLVAIRTRTCLIISHSYLLVFINKIPSFSFFSFRFPFLSQKLSEFYSHPFPYRIVSRSDKNLTCIFSLVNSDSVSRVFLSFVKISCLSFRFPTAPGQ